MKGAVQVAGVCAGVAFLIIAVIGSSISSTPGGPKIKWFKTAVACSTAVFLMMFAVMLIPGGGR